MRIEQCQWSAAGGWRPVQPGQLGAEAQLVLVFGSTGELRHGARLQELRRAYPAAAMIGCSTAGEIFGTRVSDDSVVATAVRFERTRLACVNGNLTDAAESAALGEQLAGSLDPHGLVHVFVLSDGLHVNGSELVRGLSGRLPARATVTGGLAGDGGRFQDTVIVVNGQAQSHGVVAMGLYGDGLRVGCGSLGGWDPFGPHRLVTRSRGNVVYTLDGESALELYKSYLGDQAAGLPASGLLFPLALRGTAGQPSVVRTILAVNESDQSMTFAGDVPEGAYVQLMKANFDRLIDGAIGAAKHSAHTLTAPAQLAVLISCVGRKMILKQRIEEEVEGVRDVLGPSAALTGFYSYGEISPFTPSAKCELHNQTMTITTLSER